MNNNPWRVAKYRPDDAFLGMVSPLYLRFPSGEEAEIVAARYRAHYGGCFFAVRIDPQGYIVERLPSATQN